MIRGIIIAAFTLALAACEPMEDGEPGGMIELDMMDDGTIVSKV